MVPYLNTGGSGAAITTYRWIGWCHIYIPVGLVVPTGLVLPQHQAASLFLGFGIAPEAAKPSLMTALPSFRTSHTTEYRPWK